jgi:hypothetical protein
MNPPKNPHAVALGRKGGKAGTGKAKRRGNSDYYRQMAISREAAKKLKQK